MTIVSITVSVSVLICTTTIQGPTKFVATITNNEDASQIGRGAVIDVPTEG